MKILIIEDDQSVAELERDYLEINGGFDCDLYDNGNQGLQAALPIWLPDRRRPVVLSLRCH